MKRLVFLSAGFLLLLLAFSFSTNAQKPQTVKGSFEATAANKGAVQGSYAVMPAYDNHVVLQLTPSAPFDLNAHIINAKGEEVMKIEPEHVDLRYAKSLDVSKLPAGDYFIEVIGGGSGQKNTRIPFTR